MNKIDKAKLVKRVVTTILILGIIGGCWLFAEPPDFDTSAPNVFHSFLSSMFF